MLIPWAWTTVAPVRSARTGSAIGDKQFWGQGYGREAVALLVDSAFRLRNMRRVWLTVNGRNECAQRAYRAAALWKRDGCASTSGAAGRTKIWCIGGFRGKKIGDGRLWASATQWLT